MKCKCICNKDLSRFLRTLWSWNGPSEEFYRSKELDLVPLLVFKYRLLRRAGLTLDDLAHYAERRVWLATLQSTRGRNTLVLKLDGKTYFFWVLYRMWRSGLSVRLHGGFKTSICKTCIWFSYFCGHTVSTKTAMFLAPRVSHLCFWAWLCILIFKSHK